ncbi:rab3 GTPase-activating protein regulatory subunit isoform X1 [Pieris brassicae]|uniref:rab3 GTPase-activating protein regulatory subunit isoform X1 n=1 Tax=Pieris brassicae TaxID=7116 RepID=UPI001E65E7CC|nr:rab3 GTPase-activating protein regulatory subunit isoform X1 [Pieris brassicae]
MCNVEQIADCGDILSLGRALFIPEKEDSAWLSQCKVSLSSCGNFLAVGYKNRICFLITQWISSIESNSYLISWSGTLSSEITSILAVTLCPTQQSSQNGPDWFCVIIGFNNGSVGFYTNTGHLLLLEKLDEKAVLKLSCHTGTYGTLPDDIHVLFQNCVYVITGSSLFPTLRSAKAQLAKVHAGIQDDYMVDSKNINIRKLMFSEQEVISDAAVVGLELKNTYDHLLAASTYGGYDIWYRSVPPVNTLVSAAGQSPYLGFHYAIEGGITPPLQDVARAVAHKIKSALPGWLGGSTETAVANNEPLIRAESLAMRNGLYDPQRYGTSVVVSPDKRLAAITDNLGRVSILDINKGYLIRLFKGYRDAQCAFIQLFDSDTKKPQLSMVKDIKRTMFLIIYNPKKGLIDIRLMQRGSRVAVFTATKNGKLLYNTCGLVGAEKTFAHKKLNLPEFQCVLIDPDGKLKKFNIPFYYSLEGEHLERSKDLHTFRALRDVIKKGNNLDEVTINELLKNASTLKTFECKKLWIDILIKNHETCRELLPHCLDFFWDSFGDKQSALDEKIKKYLSNIILVTLFYHHIHGYNTDEIQNVAIKIYQSCNIDITSYNHEADFTIRKENMHGFHLLEDDNCVLERLLILAQEKEYKDHQHAKVTFSETQLNYYKEFISNFYFDEKSNTISLKCDISEEKLSLLASDFSKSIFKLKNLENLTKFIKYSAIDPKDVVKLVITHLMYMPLKDFNIEFIEKFIQILFYTCCATVEATDIVYNEISEWWESIRTMLINMTCPLRSMIIAMACKAVVKIFEAENDKDDAWESVTAENAKWGILIGKLEDISILSIVLIFKDSYIGNAMTKLQLGDINVNFKSIYTRGKGSVTELIAKWLCSMGVPPEAVVVNELIETYSAASSEDVIEDQASYIFMVNNRQCVDGNPKIFKWLSLLRRQFPLSTKSDYIIANMCWEYAVEWQKDMKKYDELAAVIHCLSHVTNSHLRLGLFSITWCTYIKQVFDLSCRLVNKVGKLPKDQLCLQDLNFDSETLKRILGIITRFLNDFYQCSEALSDREKDTIQFEKIWDESLPCLVEVAQDTTNINSDILELIYQMSCTIYYQCYFNVKISKPLDTLFDIDYQIVIEALAGHTQREFNLKVSEKLLNPRMKYLTKLIRVAIETISCVDNSEQSKVYNDGDCLKWIENITNLADLWDINSDFVQRQYVIGLYHMGYDSLAENMLVLINEPKSLLPPLLAITIQRLKKSLENSKNQPEWIVSIPPQVYKRIQNTLPDSSIPPCPSLSSTVLLLQKLLIQIDKKAPETLDQSDFKTAKLLIESCEVLLRRNL